MANDKREFGVTWSTSLKLITALSVVLLGVLPLVVLYHYARLDPITIAGFAGLPLALLIGGGLFIIRGYEITDETLYINRLGWRSSIDLDTLESVSVDPNAMKSSWRLFGNGGLFCFAGKFRNKKLGTYRAFATNPADSVILKFNTRTIVVTPSQPDEFAAYLRKNV